MTKVEIDKDRITRVNGKPFFLLGARHMPDGGNPAILAEAGFNAYRVRSFGIDVDAASDPVPGNDEGIMFWSYINDRAVLGRSDRYGRELEAHVRRIKDHPALLCYENVNEAARFWKGSDVNIRPEELTEGTALLRGLDPDHPIWIAHTRHRTVETLRPYNDCGDITGCNCYPVIPSGMRRHIGVRPDGKTMDCPDQSVHAMGKYADKMMKVGQGRLAIWMQVQAMAYENWFDPRHAPEMAGQTVDPAKVLYPTFDQMRFMAYDAIVHGATGLAFSMYRTPVDQPVWKDIVALIAELKELNDALTAPPLSKPIPMRYVDLGYTIWDGVPVLARKLDQDVYLFAINTAFDPARPVFDLTEVTDDDCVFVLGEDRRVTLNSGALQDDFEPYAVHVYRMKAKSCAP